MCWLETCPLSDTKEVKDVCQESHCLLLRRGTTCYTSKYRNRLSLCVCFAKVGERVDSELACLISSVIECF